MYYLITVRCEQLSNNCYNISRILSRRDEYFITLLLLVLPLVAVILVYGNNNYTALFLIVNFSFI